MRQAAAIPVLLAMCGALAGCEWTQHVAGTINPDSLSLADRCAEVMKAAMPFAKIEITKRTSQGTGIDTIVARVEGRRSDLPKETTTALDLAMECQFDNNVLVGIHWTKGAPRHP